jgi:hypothetical protein
LLEGNVGTVPRRREPHATNCAPARMNCGNPRLAALVGVMAITHLKRNGSRLVV